MVGGGCGCGCRQEVGVGSSSHHLQHQQQQLSTSFTPFTSSTPFNNVNNVNVQNGLTTFSQPLHQRQHPSSSTSTTTADTFFSPSNNTSAHHGVPSTHHHYHLDIDQQHHRKQLPKHPEPEAERQRREQGRIRIDNRGTTFQGIPTRLPPLPTRPRGSKIVPSVQPGQPSAQPAPAPAPTPAPAPQSPLNPHVLTIAMSEFTRLLSEMSRRRSGSSACGDDGLVNLSGWSSEEVRKEEREREMEGRELEDYSAFLDFTASSDPSSDFLPSYHPTTSPSNPTVSFPSSMPSLLSSFEPSTTATQLVSDFSSPEMEGLVVGDMFPQITAHADVQPNTTANIAYDQSFVPHPSSSSNMFASFTGFGGFGCEPAFDDVGFSTLDERGVFGLSLFGGIPSSSSGCANDTRLEGRAQSRGLSEKEMSEIVAAADGLSKDGTTLTATAAAPTPTDLTTNVHRLTASPAEVFAPVPTPLMDLQDSFGSSNTVPPPTPAMVAMSSMSAHTPKQTQETARAGPVRTVSGGSSGSGSSSSSAATTTPASRKRKSSKPYEPTGTRSSRPLLDPSAPTQTKNYLAPGSTTRKLIPVGFQKKLKLTDGDALTPDNVASEVLDEIEEKRRKNCLAARESRKRKMDYLNGLKGRIGEWEEWARMVQEMARRSGLELPPTPDLDEIQE